MQNIQHLQRNLANVKRLRTKNVCWQDAVTSIWLRDQDPAVKWERWHGICTGVADCRKWLLHGKSVTCLIVKDDDNIDMVYSVVKVVHVICASQKFMATHYNNPQIPNITADILCLDALHHLYPFLRKPWDGTEEDAVAIAAHLLRFKRIVDWTNGSPERSLILNNDSIKQVFDIHPPAVYLITQFYKSNIKKRYREIKKCLVKNIENPFIDKIVLLNESDMSSEWMADDKHNKVRQVEVCKRLSYADFINYVLSDAVPKNAYVIFANADIYFTETLQKLFSINMANRMFALLRWDEQPLTDDGIQPEPVLFGPYMDSQDSWIVLSDSVKERKWDLTSKFQYNMGTPGCDNVFAVEMLRNKFIVSNPCYTIKTVHVHNSGIRSYSAQDAIIAEFYHCLDFSSISPLQQVKFDTLNPTITLADMPVKVVINSSSMSSVATFCTMVRKKNNNKYAWDLYADNISSNNLSIYSFTNISVTSNGLLYDRNMMYLEDSANVQKMWSDVNIDTFTPMIGNIPKMLAIPVLDMDATFKNPDSYCMRYLAKAIRLQIHFPGYSFYVPPNLIDLIRLFDSKKQLDKLQVPWDQHTVVFADNCVGFAPKDSTIFSREDGMALRRSYVNWKQCADSGPFKRCVVQCDTGILSDTFVTAVSGLLGELWSVQTITEDQVGSDIYNLLSGASLFIMFNVPQKQWWYKIWALPENGIVLEFQDELNICGELQYTAAALSLKSWVFMVQKDTLEKQRDFAIQTFKTWFDKYTSFAPALTLSC